MGVLIYKYSLTLLFSRVRANRTDKSEVHEFHFIKPTLRPKQHYLETTSAYLVDKISENSSTDKNDCGPIDLHILPWLGQNVQRENGEKSSEKHLVDGQVENHEKVVYEESLLGHNKSSRSLPK